MRSQRWASLGQCRHVAGEDWDSPANMLRRAPSHWLRSPAETLYILLALDGPPLARESLEGIAVQALADEFFKARGSATARLQRAIEAVNRLLYERNERAFSAGWHCGGVVCLLVRGAVAYLAQVGPPRAYVSQAGDAECYASRDAEAYLGQKETISISLSSLTLTSESRILLIDRSWGGSDLAEALTQSDAGAVWKSIVALAPTSDSSAWLIGPSSDVFQTYQGTASVAAETRHAIYSAQPAVQSQHPVRPAQPTTETQRAMYSSEPNDQIRPLSRIARRLWRWSIQVVKEVAEGVLPGPLSASGELDTQPSILLQPYLPTVALGIPLLALVLTGILYWKTQVAAGTESAAYLNQAKRALSAARQFDADQDAVRVYLESALAQIDEALALRPGQRDAQELREEAQSRLDVLNRVTRLSYVTVLYEYPPEGRPSRVLQARGAIYVLDRQTNRVYRHHLEESGKALTENSTVILLHQGQEMGGTTVGALTDILWVPAGDAGRLLILDQEGTLWVHVPDGEVQSLALPALGSGSAEDWRLSSYEERLYVLVPHQDQVFRYRPIGSSFRDPETYFLLGREPDCSGVSDMAIDGHIYLLWERGLIRRFLGGMEQDLSISLPDGPLGRTTALFARPDKEAAYLYVADATRQRVVQLTKGGDLVRQLKPQDPGLFTDLGGVSVDEAQGRLLVTDGHLLLLAEVPPEMPSER